MPIFILLSTLTQQGVQTLKSNPERLRQVNKDVEELGCKVLHQWATLGEFDFVNVVDAPDTATIAKVSVSLGARGSIRIQTLKSNPERLRAVNQDVEELGCKVLHQWATLGEFDFINVVEAPDEATIARVSVSLGARGSTKIQTLPALSIEDFLRSIES